MRRRGQAGMVFLGLLAPAALALAAPPAPTLPVPSAADLAFFENKVRPVLLERCGKCHGEKVQQAGLRLDTAEGLRKGSEHGAVVLAQEPEKSPLLRAVRYEGGLQMPPDGKLLESEIAALTTWIKSGAPWPTTNPKPETQNSKPADRPWWSFHPVRMPAIPRVKNRAWVKTPIDAFILAQLESKGLSPAPPADRRTLIRRVTYDLTGLPPTPAENQAFLADQSPNAWEKVVDRLLASPAYGERWGRHWLDLARYADSKDVRDIGQPYDIVESYRYRDWVVKAFNEDLPYDQFILDQLAGDLLPPSQPGGVNVDGITATTFLTIGCWGPGDADTQKMYTDMVDDQINAVSRAFLGLTVGCARCHDHKFDPITTADYYGLAGIFFSTQIAIPQISAPYNKIPLLPPAEIERRERYLARVPQMEKELKGYVEARYAELPRRYLPETGSYLRAAWGLRGAAPAAVKEAAARSGLRPEFLSQWVQYLDQSSGPTGLMTQLLLNTNGPGIHAWRNTAMEPVAVINTTDQTVHVPGTMPPHSVAVHPGPTTGVAVGWQAPAAGTFRVTGKITDAHAACGDGIEWEIQRVRNGAAERLAGAAFGDGGGSSLAEPAFAQHLQGISIRPGDQLRFVVLPRANHGCDLTLMDLQIEESSSHQAWNLARDILSTPFRPGEGNPHADSYGHAGVWSFLDMGLLPSVVRVDPAGPLAAYLAAKDAGSAAGVAGELQRALSSAGAEEDLGPLGRLWRDLASAQGPFRITQRDDEHLLSPEVRAELRRRQAEIDAYRQAAPEPIPYAMGAREGGVPGTKYAGFHDAAIHIRGRYDRLGEVVPRRFPLVLAGEHQPPITHGSGRLELARWIASPANPLTARVMVNRVWQHHFGEGLVRTPGNFGKLGEPPTHPELLDWLAAVFASGDVSSFGFRASRSEPRAQGAAAANETVVKPETRNPKLENRAWSLKSLHRLILLSSTYRQSSRPRPELRDPENRLWGRASVRRLEAEAIRDTVLAVSGQLDTRLGGPPQRKPGEDALSRRRAIYLMTNRSDKTGFRFLYDAADPENIVDRRTVSTVAPQSLFLLNDPFMLEQTRALADRLLAPPGESTEQRLSHAYELLYGRPPTPAELALGTGFLSKHAGTDEARKAAWLEYCQVLLCANELIYVD